MPPDQARGGCRTQEFLPHGSSLGFLETNLRKCHAEDPTLQSNRDFWRDWFNIVVGLIWEMSMVTTPIFLVIQHYAKALLCVGVFAVTSAILKFTWYNNLEPAEKPTQILGTVPDPTAN